MNLKQLKTKAKLAAPRWVKTLAARLNAPLEDHGDGMFLRSRNRSHLERLKFLDAYSHGMASGHKLRGGGDLHMEWRVHTALWAAQRAMALPGDLVECGVNTGVMSLAICRYLNLTSSNYGAKWFWLFDTFEGIPVEQASATERDHALIENQLHYEDCWQRAKENFRPYPKAYLIRGRVPQTLNNQIFQSWNGTRGVSYLSLDMNIAAPEEAALKFFWPMLNSGAVVLLDDYGFKGYEAQRHVADHLAADWGVPILSLPTGQGVIIKP